MGKREQIAAAKKHAIMSSPDYKAFVFYRRQAPNPPKDYYLSYTTDKALRAPQEDRTPWSKHPYAADWGKVDSPTYPHYTPKPKPTAKPVAKPKPQPKPAEKPKRPVEDEIKEIGQRMSAKYGAPNVGSYDLRKEQGPMVGSMSMARNSFTGSVLDSKITMGTGGSHGPTVATAAHEFGHLAHAGGKNKEVIRQAGVNVEYHAGLGRTKSRSPTVLKTRYNNEVAAWKLGQHIIDELPGKERAKAQWHKRFALQSYSHVQIGREVEGKTEKIKWGRRVF